MTFKTEGEGKGPPTFVPPLHQIMVTGSGGPTASQDSWKEALGGTARSFGSTVKNGTPGGERSMGLSLTTSQLPTAQTTSLFFEALAAEGPTGPYGWVCCSAGTSLTGELFFDPLRVLFMLSPWAWQILPSQTFSDSPSLSKKGGRGWGAGRRAKRGKWAGA